MTWVGFERDRPGGAQLVGLEGALLDTFPVSGLPYAYEAILSARSVAPGDVAPTERSIRDLASRAAGRVVATVRSRGRLNTLLYLPSDEFVDALAATPVPPQATISVDLRFDPTWRAFQWVLPVGMETQSMDDFAMIGRLLEQGDGGAPREIEHRVSAIPDLYAAGFLAAIEQLGLSIDFEGVAVDGARVAVITHRCAPSDVTPTAWGIRRTADRFSASYQGWRCEVVRTPTSAGRHHRRRGLFRR